MTATEKPRKDDCAVFLKYPRISLGLTRFLFVSYNYAASKTTLLRSGTLVAARRNLQGFDKSKSYA